MDVNLDSTFSCLGQELSSNALFLASTLDGYEVHDVAPAQIWKYLPKAKVDVDSND